MYLWILIDALIDFINAKMIRFYLLYILRQEFHLQ